MLDEPALLTTEQAALTLGETPQQLRIWHALHEGPLVVHVGTATLYRRHDLEQWASSHVTGRPRRDDLRPVRVRNEHQGRIASGM